MTNVIPSVSPRAGFQVQPSAPFPANLTQVHDAITSHPTAGCAISTATWHLYRNRTETGGRRVPEMEGLSHD